MKPLLPNRTWHASDPKPKKAPRPATDEVRRKEDRYNEQRDLGRMDEQRDRAK